MTRLVSTLAAALIAIATLAAATTSFAADYYLNPAQVDLIQILAPPPAPDSAKGKADLQAVLDAQRDRTPAEVKSAQADARLSVFRFADVVGPGFKPDKLPFATQFFARVVIEDEHAIDVAKAIFHRPRPYVLDHAVKPAVPTTMNGYTSYPSGHATFAYATAIVLANMVPEKAAAIFDRADRFAENRVIGGVHYPTDLQAGRISASVIANVLLHDPRFEADFRRARGEVRHALGLGPAHNRGETGAAA
jgi:acid phosphatase (class A)